MRQHKRLWGMILALSVALATLGGVAGAAPAAGENGYVSLHNYVTTTDDPSIFKVTLHLTAQVEPDPVDVVFVLDDTGSMTSNTMNGGSGPQTRWWTMNQLAVPAAIDKIWGSNVSEAVKKKIQIGIVCFEYNRITHNTGGLLNYTDRTTWAGATSLSGALSTTGDPADAVSNWVKAFVNHPSGTTIYDGLNQAYNWLSSSSQSSQPGLRRYVLALTDGSDVSSTYLNADNMAAALKAPAYATNVANTGRTGLGSQIWTVGLNPGTTENIPTRMMGLAMDFAPTYYPYTTAVAGAPASDAVAAGVTAYQSASDTSWQTSGKGPVQSAGGTFATPPRNPGTNTFNGSYYYGKENPSWLNTPIDDTLYYHCITQEEAVAAFDEFGSTVSAFDDPDINIQNNTAAFTPYTMPGQPMFSYTGPNATEAFLSGGNVRWEFPGGIESNELYTLSYFVKMNDGLDASVSYPVILGATVDYEFDSQSYNITFPLSYIRPGGAIEQDDTLPGMTDATAQSGFTGMDGHQENRDNAKSTGESMGYRPDVSPIGMNVKAGTAASGRSKAIIEVENGSLMRFQWQVKTESGQWEDVFGATSSQYTLNPNQFKAGETYTLRCLVTNPAGTVTISQELSITAAAGGASASLQSK